MIEKLKNILLFLSVFLTCIIIAFSGRVYINKYILNSQYKDVYFKYMCYIDLAYCR